MDNLNEMIEETEEGFEDLDTLFPSPDGEYAEEEKPVEKPRRGRPKKKAAEESEEEKPKTKAKSGPKKKVKSAEEESEKDVKKIATKKKKVDVSQLPMEIIDEIFKKYSQEPVDKIAKDYDLTIDQVVETIKTLDEMFQLAVSTGDLTMEQFEEKIAPKLVPYSDSMRNFQTYVKCEVKHINEDDEEEEEN